MDNFITEVSRSPFVMIYPLYAVPVLLIGIPYWFFRRKQIKVFWWEYTMIILPFLFWRWMFYFFGGGSKSFTNISVEPILLGVLSVIAIFLKGKYNAQINRKLLSFILCGVLCISGMLIWIFIPFLAM